LTIDWYRLLPKYWFQTYKTCDKWDKELNQLLDQEPLHSPTLYSIYLKNVYIHASGWPHSFGCKYDLRTNLVEFQKAPVLPRVTTRLRLKKRIEEYVEGLNSDA